MSNVSTMSQDLSMRKCLKCGSKNGLQTLRMMEQGNRALKECKGCGHRCIVNYKTKRLEEYNPET